MYKKSSIWSYKDTVLLVFLSLGSGLILSDSPENFLFITGIFLFLFGLYLGVNSFSKYSHYRDIIGLNLILDEEEKKLTIGSSQIKFSEVKKITMYHIPRTGWKLEVQETNKKHQVISPDCPLVVSQLKKHLPKNIFYLADSSKDEN